MTPLPFQTLVEAADAIAMGKVSSRELTQECLWRIAAVDPTLHAFVEVETAAALSGAEAADRSLAAGVTAGPLHGVPLAHKDMFYRASEVTGCGSRIRETWLASTTATVLERLRAAGAVQLGRLAMVEFAMGPHGFNAHLPRCRNPWLPDRIPCGSSSGSAVAVASRMAFASLGSDTGGSIRGPAAACGVVGLAPSYGRVSRFGAMPMSFSLDVVGPIGRTARDVARMLGVIAGADPSDGNSARVSVPDYETLLEQPISGLRIGVPDRYFRDGLDPDVEAALDASLEVLARAGASVRSVAIPGWITEVADLHPLVMKAEGAANHQHWMNTRRQEYSAEVGSRLEAGFFILATDYIQALKLRGEFVREFAAQVFSQVDVLHTPVLAQRLPTFEQTRPTDGPAYLRMVASLTRTTKPVNFLGLCAASVPCGFDTNGAPIGMQLIGRPFAEAQILSVAHHYERSTGWSNLCPDL
jgi:aspartyl-tRNA(Asn)/glutamyl-tRNA(Gln) amidotransferase subunit A